MWIGLFCMWLGTSIWRRNGGVSFCWGFRLFAWLASGFNSSIIGRFSDLLLCYLPMKRVWPSFSSKFTSWRKSFLTTATGTREWLSWDCCRCGCIPACLTTIRKTKRRVTGLLNRCSLVRCWWLWQLRFRWAAARFKPFWRFTWSWWLCCGCWR